MTISQDKSLLAASPAFEVGSLHTASYLRTYLILPLLLFFAVHGVFSFEGNEASALSQIGGSALNAGYSESQTWQAQIINGVAFTLVLLLISQCFNEVMRAATRLKWFTLLSLLALASSLWSQEPSLSFRRGIFLLLSSLFAYYFIEKYSPDRQMQLLILSGVVAGAGSAVMALFFPKWGLDHIMHEGSWQGIFPHKNECAGSLLFFLAPIFYGKTKLWSLRGACYTSLLLFVIAMSQSRTGWLMTLMFFALMIGLKLVGRFVRKDLLWIALLAGIVISASGILLVENLNALMALFGRDATFTGRTEIWSAVLVSILKRPLLGYGYSAFWTGMQGEASNIVLTIGWVVPHSHNGFLDVWLQLGVVGLCLLLITLFKVFRDALTCFRVDRPRYVDWYIGVIFLTFAYDLVEPGFVMDRKLQWVLYIVACAGLSKAAENVRKGMPSDQG